MTATTRELEGRFPSADQADAFLAAYRSELARWPKPVTARDVPGPYGTTRVQVCGPPDGAAVILLHGGGCTSTCWFAAAGVLGGTHRIYAPDQMGDAGMSVPSGRQMKRVEDYMAWLDGLFDGLGITSGAVCGHSYGAWLALNYALHAPSKVTKLALLDPTSCFAGLSLAYRLHALPAFVRPSAKRARRLFDWETGGRQLDPGSTALSCLSAEFRTARVVMPRQPSSESLRALVVPTLLVLAEHSKAHDIRQVRAGAEGLLPHLDTRILGGASHHSIPSTDPTELSQELGRFFEQSWRVTGDRDEVGEP